LQTLPVYPGCVKNAEAFSKNHRLKTDPECYFRRVSGSGEPVPAFRGFVFSGSAGKPVLPSFTKSSGI
jgi:hypothetical protein